MIIFICFIWWLIGFSSCIFVIFKKYFEITLLDILLSIFSGFLGLVGASLCFCLTYGDVVIYKKRVK